MDKFSVAVVIPRLFRKKGKGNRVQFYGLAGTIPSRNLTEPNIAEEDGFIIGKKYEVVVNEVEYSSTWGRRFRWVCAGEWTGSLQQAIAEYGEPVVINVESQDDFISIGSNKVLHIAKPINDTNN